MKAQASLRAPLKSTICWDKTVLTTVRITAVGIVSEKAVMKALYAPSLSFRPILMAMIVVPPIGNIATTATADVTVPDSGITICHQGRSKFVTIEIKFFRRGFWELFLKKTP